MAGAIVLVVVLVVAALVVAGGGGGGEEKAQREPQPDSTTSTAVAVPVAPLTGIADPNRESLKRAALTVKIENAGEARPQAGLDIADVVYEEVVEGGITRFAAVFNSRVPTTVGPVRSVRQMDADIVWPIAGIFAYSGGAQINVSLIRTTPAKTVDETEAGGAMFRSTSRFAPHNLYGRGADLFALGGQPTPPKPLFEYLNANEVPVGESLASARVGFTNGFDPTYTWDAGVKGWKRSYGTTPFTAESGQVVAPANVIIQFVPYSGEGEGNLVGEGEAWVLTDGTLRRGRWTRSARDQITRFVDSTGAVIRLRPGTTWVELLPAGSAVDLVAGPPITAPATTTTLAKTTTTKKSR